MVLASHVILGVYGFWLPNDPRGSGSTCVSQTRCSGTVQLAEGPPPLARSAARDAGVSPRVSRPIPPPRPGLRPGYEPGEVPVFAGRVSCWI